MTAASSASSVLKWNAKVKIWKNDSELWPVQALSWSGCANLHWAKGKVERRLGRWGSGLGHFHSS